MNEMDGFVGADELGRDMELAEALALIDPASSDPAYWLRFRARVLGGAARELARRRLLAQLTIGDVMRSWARTVVPTALATAIVAGLLLVRSGALEPPLPIGVEELLVSEIEGETLPAMLEAEESAAVMFASEVF
jgi:hypothetical protein